MGKSAFCGKRDESLRTVINPKNFMPAVYQTPSNWRAERSGGSMSAHVRTDQKPYIQQLAME